MKPLIPAIAVSAVLLTVSSACASAKAPLHHHHAAPPALTAAEGASICEDLAAWLPKAANEDTPRFTAKLEADVTKARDSKLGLDLTGLDSDLLSENATALLPGPPGDPQNVQLVKSDCQSYGVTLPDI
jgi:hypothetical protein